MQSSAGKEIEIWAALSSDYGPRLNTGQSFVEKLGQNSDRLLTKSDPLKFFFGFMVHLGVVILTVYNSMKHKQAKKPGSL